jgi:hypothetical protein
VARKFIEEVEVEKLSDKDVEDLMHSLDHCLLMANKFYETRKPEYYTRMEATCEKFMEQLKKLREKATKARLRI